MPYVFSHFSFGDFVDIPLIFRSCLANSEAKLYAAGPEPKIKISSISILFS